MNLLSNNRHVRDGSGACMFGQDSSRWPGWWFDAVEAEEIFKKLEHNSRAQAEMDDLKRSSRNAS